MTDARFSLNTLADEAFARGIVTEEHIEEFVRDGVVVIEDVLDANEVAAARAGLHAALAAAGVPHEALLSGEVDVASTTAGGVRLHSPAARFFYARWRLLNVALHERVVRASAAILRATFARGANHNNNNNRNNNDDDDDNDDALFAHPFGAFDSLVGYADRVAYRLPDSVRAEGGLGLHIDRNVGDEFGALEHKWRPVQGFVALTDQFGSESGGLRVVRGFHREYSRFDFGARDTAPRGEFHRLPGARFASLARRCAPVDAPAGALVLWDNRLPHATAASLAGADSREAVYAAALPATPLNCAYRAAQWSALEANRAPPAYADAAGAADRDWPLDALTPEQAFLLGAPAR